MKKLITATVAILILTLILSVLCYAADNTLSAQLIGKEDLANQELYSFDTATKTGSWAASGGTLVNCYYGNGTAATISWNMAPKYTHKYSIELYVPCINNMNTTANGVATLTLDGKTYTCPINERQEDAYRGWYSLGIFDLTANENVTLALSMTTGQFLRAKAARLVPVTDTVTANSENGEVTLNAGNLTKYAKAIIYAEYNDFDNIEKIEILNDETDLTVTMNNAENKYRFFIWKDFGSMIPLLATVEN